MKNILLLGGGGHCASVADTLLCTGEYSRIGIVVNDAEAPLFGCIPILGSDKDLPALKKNGYDYSFVTVGSIGNTEIRRKLFSLIRKYGFQIPNIIDPSAVVSRYSKLGSGIFIGKNAVVNAESTIGDAAIINTASVTEHNCVVGAYVHLAPSSTICGAVQIGESSHLGAGATVIQGVHIGKNVMIGAGATVIHDLPDNCTAIGNPARVWNRK